MSAHPPWTNPFDERRPFLFAAGVRAGIPPSTLRGRRFRRLMLGVYLRADVAPDPVHMVVAALLVHPPRAYASHASAARVYGVPLPAGLAQEHVSVCRAADRRRREDIRNHVVAASTPVVRFRGLPVSAPAQVFVELSGLLTLVDLVAVGDDLVRRKLLTTEQLVDYCRLHGDAAARTAAGYVRRGVDSPMETRLRMLLVLSGLPEPKVNVKLFFEDGRLRYRFDLAWPELKIAVEYDGRQHRDDLDQWDHDVTRDEWMDDANWLRVPVFSRGIYRRPDVTIERVVKALRERGFRVAPGDLSEAWRPHFPVIY
ncbi:endonuclease domain-containing protein [Nocardioides mesophilus]|uniref:DUF559 domain-containing protein n=1 Tax=Nocardioides mesophilus TaxID=433659 RepID=A0A7G9REU4_9ACTN|nr:hypothetical protein [Nocardioides mesophilus]QNN54119.1 hypothetical protein H9L09_07030 [Nocardioides mesophilus]